MKGEECANDKPSSRTWPYTSHVVAQRVLLSLHWERHLKMLNWWYESIQNTIYPVMFLVTLVNKKLSYRRDGACRHHKPYIANN